MDKVLKGIIGMESGSLTNELIDFFDASADVPTSSAFVQQRAKIKAHAFKEIFDGVTNKFRSECNKHMPILAVFTFFILQKSRTFLQNKKRRYCHN